MQKTIVIAILFISAFILSTCAHKENMEKKDSISYERKSSSKYEKGYNLPVEESEKEEAQADLKSVTKNTDALNTTEYPLCYDKKLGMHNYGKIEKFLKQSSNNQKGSIVFFAISSGSVSRNKLIFDGEDMYLLYTNCTWNKENIPVMAETYFNRIEQWKYTEKGWFCYELCTPKPPEVTEVVDGSCMFRITPIKEEYRELAEKYLLPLGYQGNNLLCSNWDGENLEHLDYTGLFEYLYYMKYNKKIDYEKYQDGIPKELFENLMTEYLPVTVKQLRKYAAFHQTKQMYPWCRLNCMNYTPNAFGGAIPEVTGIEENEDGSLSVKIDAVCERLQSDCVMRHILTVKIYDDGSIQYLGNQILDDGLKNIPTYQYRLGNHAKETIYN